MLARRLFIAFAAASCAAAAHAVPGALSPFAPAGIASDRFESHPAFDPLTGDFYFVRSAPDFSGWRLYVARCTPTGWDAAIEAPFAGDGVEADPWFTHDGRTLYFISTRTTDGVHGRNLDLWTVTRGASLEWGTPQRLPEPLSSTGREWFPRVGADGWLYFGSDRAGGLGKTDIWRARQSAGQWLVENLGSAINTAANEFEAEMSADGKRLIIMADDGLFESAYDGKRWQPRVKLPPQINANGTEVGALLSPSGRSMLFARDTRSERSGEFFIWRAGKPEAWPPTCPMRKPAAR